ncbi:MATE family efflux transporter [Treponema parvum]|uniref:MATE family efflux transporter n=1 Tax=Treponema parvum TaxID=138851 RepID=A0A975F4L8_9SPIR|nr:MATE family efflux transporter [Treponema parvum]QTQ14228.1 MATE family efflux transporter [Treponema parvum]QTQ16467.1 MATE family efflux transporter [Treponema parvum]
MSTSNLSKENRMGNMPVARLLVSMSLPIMISMFVMALYNIVDSIFVSMISEEALTAVSIAFPLQTLAMAFGIGTSVGVGAVLSMRLGEKNQEAVNKTAVNGIFLGICNYIGFAVIVFPLLRAYFSTQTSDQRIIDYGVEYMQIIVVLGLGTFLGTMFDRLLQSTGRTFYTMITQITGALTNIILDPILIFGIGPFPKMGMQGAALATVIGQILGGILSFIFNMRFNNDIKFKFKKFRPDGTIILHIYKIAVPTILMQSINSITTYGMNLVLGIFSSTAIAVYGVYFKLNSFIFMPVFGLNNGMIPIIAFNYGAKQRSRIIKTIKSALSLSLLIMTIGVILFETAPAALLKLFNASNAMLEIGIPALRTIAPSFFGAAFAIILISVFQALGNAVYSMLISFTRQLIVLLPVAYILSLTGKIDNVWFCFIIAEVFSLLCCFLFLRRIYDKKLRNM